MSTISRNRRCKSIASGVFNCEGRTSPPTRRSMLVSNPGRRPASRRIACSRNAVVVLPVVPVTAATSSSRLGSPKNSTAAGAIARRESATTTCGAGRSSARSTTSATAPRFNASSARSCPSDREPRTQKKSTPGPAARLSYARSVISTGAGFRMSAGASAGASRSSCIACEPSRASRLRPAGPPGTAGRSLRSGKTRALPRPRPRSRSSAR